MNQILTYVNFKKYSSAFKTSRSIFFSSGEEIEIGLVEINPVEALNTVTLRSNNHDMTFSDLMDTGGMLLLLFLLSQIITKIVHLGLL